jgi:MoxR-like ATPase
MTKNKGSQDYSKIFTSDILGLVDRERETKQLMYALFTREHMLLMGPAGTAKSQFAQNAFSAIDGAKVFSIHLTKQTTEEYVYGPLNIIELKKGNLLHNTKDSILDADFAFLDEFFDASDVLLRSLLGVLNERHWMKGSQQIPAILHTAIVTSNYQRENEVTQAVLDRLIFKAEIQPITAKNKRIEVYQNFLAKPNFKPAKVIDLAKLKQFTELVDKPDSVKFPKDVLEAFDLLLEEYCKESKKYISQRTANKSLKVVKVSALLDGRDIASYADLEELKYVFCVLNRRMEEEIFDAVYERCVGKAEEERQVMIDLGEIESKVSAMPTDFGGLSDQDFITKMRELNEYIHLIEGMAHPTTKTTSKRDDILSRMRNLVANNRDKLFKKTDVKALADPIAKPVKEEELEVVEPEEVLEDEDGGTAVTY